MGERPTDAFAVPSGTRPFVMVTVRSPTDNGIFAGIEGVATLRVVAAGAAPRVFTDAEGRSISEDPKVNIGKAQRWQRLELRPGEYRFYSMFGGPTVAVIACPD